MRPCLDTGREASRLWQLGRKCAWRDFTPTPNTTTPHPQHHPPLNRWILQETKDAFMCLTGGGVSVRGWLIQAPSSWRRSCSDQSQSQPATLSQQRHMTQTRIARLTKTPPTAPWHLLRWCTISTSDFFLGHRRQSSSQVPWALFSLPLPPFLRLLCCSSVFPLWNGASTPLRIYFFKCMKECFKLPNMILAAAAAAALARHGDQSEIPLRVLSANSPSI